MTKFNTSPAEQQWSSQLDLQSSSLVITKSKAANHGKATALCMRCVYSSYTAQDVECIIGYTQLTRALRLRKDLPFKLWPDTAR